MRKITSFTIGEFTGTLYLYKLGYGYKIVYKKKTVATSYVYFVSKELCFEKMCDELKILSGFNKNLFDLERIQ